MFEVDVTAHYIARSPQERSQQYVQFARVISKRTLDACSKHRNSTEKTWRDVLSLEWEACWAGDETEFNTKYDEVRPVFERISKKGKPICFQSWSGKTIRQMAVEVEHEEAYDILYAALSDYAHAGVYLADHFLKWTPDGPRWSQRSDWSAVGSIFRYAAIFMTCFAELFGKEFATWTESDVRECWEVEGRL